MWRDLIDDELMDMIFLQVSKTLVINGRAALLGEQRNNTFCDVACGRGLNSDITYCVTSSGLLCSVNSKRVLDSWVELKVNSFFWKLTPVDSLNNLFF